MVDNTAVKNATGATVTVATDELSDSSQSPKVSLLDGSTSPTPISPATSGLQTTANTSIGATNETAASTDTATAGLNGRLQRIAQRLTSLIALLPSALTGSGNLKVALQESSASQAVTGTFWQTTQPVSGTVSASKSATIDDASDVTLNNGSEISIAASDSTRREAIIVADPDNTVSVRIGKTGQVGAARGALLQPGQSIALQTTAAIYGYAGAASQKVSVLLLKD